MILILRIDSAITRSIIGTLGPSKIQHQLHSIMLFALLLPNGLNKALCLNITNQAFLNQAIVTDLKSNTSALFFSASTYKGEKV